MNKGLVGMVMVLALGLSGCWVYKDTKTSNDIEVLQNLHTQLAIRNTIISELDREIAQLKNKLQACRTVQEINREDFKKLQQEIRRLKYWDTQKMNLLICFSDMNTTDEDGIIKAKIADVIQCAKDKELDE